MSIKFFAVAAVSIVIGLICGVLCAALYWGKTFVNYVALQQQIELNKTRELAWKAYSNERPVVGIWALSNYAGVLDETYSVRPAKDKEYYYYGFVINARQFRLLQETGNQKAAADHLQEAVELMKGWSKSPTTNSDQILDEIKKIDASEKRATKN